MWLSPVVELSSTWWWSKICIYIYIHIKIDSDFTENLSMMVHPNLQSPHSGVVNSGGISPSTRSDDVGVGHPMIKGFGALSSKTFGRHPNPGTPLDCIATTSHNLQPRIYHRNETLNTLRQSMRVTLQSTPALFIFQDLLVAHIWIYTHVYIHIYIHTDCRTIYEYIHVYTRNHTHRSVHTHHLQTGDAKSRAWHDLRSSQHTLRTCANPDRWSIHHWISDG